MPAIYVPSILLCAWPVHFGTTLQGSSSYQPSSAEHRIAEIHTAFADGSRTINRFHLDLIFYMEDGSTNLLQPEFLQRVKDIERGVENVGQFAEWCRTISSTNSACRPPQSLLNFFYPSVSSDESNGIPTVTADGKGEEMQPVEVVLDELQRLGIYWYTSRTFPQELKSVVLRTRFEFGAPADGLEEGFRAFLSADMYPYLQRIQWQSDLNMRVLWESTELGEYEANAALLHDCYLLLGSILLAGLAMAVYTRSIFLALNTLIAALSAILLAFIVFKAVLGYASMSLFNFLALFVVIAVSSQTLYIWNDQWLQSKGSLGDRSVQQRLSWAWHEITWKLFVTTATTSSAFLTSLASPIPSMRELGVFTALALWFNFLCITAVLPPSFAVATSSHTNTNKPVEGRKESRTFFVEGENQISKKASTSFVVCDEAERRDFKLSSSSGHKWIARVFHNAISAQIWAAKWAFLGLSAALAIVLFVTSTLLHHPVKLFPGPSATLSTEAMELSRDRFGSYGTHSTGEGIALSLPLCSDSSGSNVLCTYAPTARPTLQYASAGFRNSTGSEALVTTYPSAAPFHVNDAQRPPSTSIATVTTPTGNPTLHPTLSPSVSPTLAPSRTPSSAPTQSPIACPCVGRSSCITSSNPTSAVTCKCFPGWTEESNCTELAQTFSELPDSATETLTFAWVLQDTSRSNWTAIQQQALSFCTTLQEKQREQSASGLDVDLLFRSIKRCPIQDFAVAWLPSRGFSFPIHDVQLLGTEMNEFLRVNNWAEGLLITDPSALPLLIGVEVQTGIDSMSTATEGNVHLRAWNVYGKAHAGLAVQLSPLWTRLGVESLMVTNALKLFAISTTVSFVIALIGLCGDLIVAISTTLTLYQIAGTFLGWMGTVIGRGFGAGEAVGLILLAGMGLDPCIYLALSVAGTRRQSAYCAVRDALTRVGAPLVSASLTTILSTLPLFFGRAPLSVRMAETVLAIAVTTMCYVFCFLVPCLMLVGKRKLCGTSTDPKVVNNKHRDNPMPDTTDNEVKVEVKEHEN